MLGFFGMCRALGERPPDRIADMIDPNTLTEKSRNALVAAQEQATGHGHPQVEPIHLAVALFADADGLARRLAEKVGADPRAIEAALLRVLAEQPGH